MTIFTEGDRHSRVAGSADDDTSGEKWTHGEGSGTDCDASLLDHAYIAYASHVRDRLDLMGFTVARARAAYEAGREEELQFLRRSLADEAVEPYLSHRRNELRVLEELTFDNWIIGFQWMKNRGANAIWDDGPIPDGLEHWCIPRESAPEYVQRMFDRGTQDDSFYGFYASDPRWYLRAVLEICSDDSLVSQDISALVSGGYYAEDDRVADLCRMSLTEDYPVNARVIVLTEGSTDQEFLGKSLDLLNPHLVDYYSFMDFHTMAVEGGAGRLVATVKAFAGAGITNRVVALFDNDTAGRDATRQLAKFPLPTNYRVLNYPPLHMATSWPTLGPTGPNTMDVNGLAGSIELYFGQDVLKRDGELEPVQWRGLVCGMGEYQGELIAKTELQQRFREKLNRAYQNRSLLGTLDWSGMRAILDAVRRAFQ